MLWPIKLDSVGRSHSKLLSCLHHLHVRQKRQDARTKKLEVSVLKNEEDERKGQEVEGDCGWLRKAFLATGFWSWSLLLNNGRGWLGVSPPSTHCTQSLVLCQSGDMSLCGHENFLVRKVVFKPNTHK